MEKINVDHFLGNDEVDQEKLELIQTLEKDPLILKLTREQNIPLSYVRMYPYRFESWRKGMTPCVTCKGLNQCKQDQKGFYSNLRFEDDVMLQTLEACKYRLTKEADTKHLEKFFVNDLGPDYETLSFATTDITKENGAYLQVFIQTQQAFMQQKGVYLYGNMGSGKTYLAACCANDMAKQGHSVAFVHMPSFMQRLSDANRNSYASGDFDEVDYLGFADFVVFDDIGAEHVNDSNRATLLSILERRMQHERMTWFTSNEDLESLKDHYNSTYYKEDPLQADRILERIQFLAKPVALLGDDRRILQKENR